MSIWDDFQNQINTCNGSKSGKRFSQQAQTRSQKPVLLEYGNCNVVMAGFTNTFIFGNKHADVGHQNTESRIASYDMEHFP